MVTHDPAVFAAIADSTRRAILDALRGRERAAGEIAALFPVISRPAVSKHLRVLRAASLVAERRVAQSRLYSLNAAPLQEVDRWIEYYRVYWSARLLDLKRYAESPEGRAP
jgi:DNA-binding transcriptional ArsR family regulator